MGRRAIVVRKSEPLSLRKATMTILNETGHGESRSRSKWRLGCALTIAVGLEIEREAVFSAIGSVRRQRPKNTYQHLGL